MSTLLFRISSCDFAFCISWIPCRTCNSVTFYFLKKLIFWYWQEVEFYQIWLGRLTGPNDVKLSYPSKLIPLRGLTTTGSWVRIQPTVGSQGLMLYGCFNNLSCYCLFVFLSDGCCCYKVTCNLLSYQSIYYLTSWHYYSNCHKFIWFSSLKSVKNVFGRK